MLLNIPYYASYLHLLFSNRNSKINAYIYEFNLESVAESSKENRFLTTFCIVRYLCLIEMTVVDIQT